MFGLHRFKFHRHLVDGTVKFIWFRQVFGLLGVRFTQGSVYSGFGLGRFSVYSGFGLDRVRFTQGSG